MLCAWKHCLVHIGDLGIQRLYGKCLRQTCLDRSAKRNWHKHMTTAPAAMRLVFRLTTIKAPAAMKTRFTQLEQEAPAASIGRVAQTKSKAPAAKRMCSVLTSTTNTAALCTKNARAITKAPAVKTSLMVTERGLRTLEQHRTLPSQRGDVRFQCGYGRVHNGSNSNIYGNQPSTSIGFVLMRRLRIVCFI